MKDFESIREKYVEKYGPGALSFIIHAIFFLLIWLASSSKEIEGEIPNYIEVMIGSPAELEDSNAAIDNNSNLVAPLLQQLLPQQIQPQQLSQEFDMTSLPSSEDAVLYSDPNQVQELQPEEQQLQEQQIAPQAAAPKAEARKERQRGYERGNSYDGQDSASYLEWLQLTVQETSKIPIQAREANISGNAVLRLTFNRAGYVREYSLVRATGSKILDAAALRVARKLRHEPFPPMPTDFEQGKKIVTYDFPISFVP